MRTAKKIRMRVTLSELAMILDVDRRQVYTWDRRRDRNGFPESIGAEERRQGVHDRVWDLDAVLAWRSDYRPSVGGRPIKKTC